MSVKLVLVGADNHVTTLSIRTFKTRKKDNRPGRQGHLRIYRAFSVGCSCKKLTYPEVWDQVRALVVAEVHARLWHGAEPDRGKWRNPNVEVG